MKQARIVFQVIMLYDTRLLYFSEIMKEYRGLESTKEKLSREISTLEASKMSVAHNSDYTE